MCVCRYLCIKYNILYIGTRYPPPEQETDNAPVPKDFLPTPVPDYNRNIGFYLVSIFFHRIVIIIITIIIVRVVLVQ